MSNPRPRDEILRRIGAALADRPDPGPVPRGYRRAGAPTAPGDLVERFARTVAEYKATVRRVPPAALPAAIAAAIDQRGARHLAVPPGLPDGWLAETGIQAHGDIPPLSVRALDQLDGVVTGCAVAIADTGTIVLDAGPGQGRRALTLLPDYHLCVVAADQIVATVPDALARLDPRRPQTWISGPSATSDIELNRVEGVHGPRTLHVIVAG